MEMRAKEPIIPGLLVDDLEGFTKRLDFARKNAGSVHIDVADGKFVETKTLHPSEWPELSVEYAEAHLMVEDPVSYLLELKEKRITRAIVHLESKFDPLELAERAREADILLGFTLNPDTDLDAIRRFLEYSSYIQVMGIYPGKTGQPMERETPFAVSFLRHLPNKRLTITVDGGVHLDTIGSLAHAGANYFIASSALYDQGDWQENYERMTARVSDDR